MSPLKSESFASRLPSFFVSEFQVRAGRRKPFVQQVAERERSFFLLAEETAGRSVFLLLLAAGAFGGYAIVNPLFSLSACVNERERERSALNDSLLPSSDSAFFVERARVVLLRSRKRHSRPDATATADLRGVYHRHTHGHLSGWRKKKRTQGSIENGRRQQDGG